MTQFRRSARLVQLFAVGFGLLAAGVTASERAPRFVLQAPAELERFAREIESAPASDWESLLELTGLDSFDPQIVVVLAPESSPEARRAARWINGWADGRRGFVVLFPERVGGYPDRKLRPLLRHELMHVLVARAADGRRLPRWFDEGLAMAGARQGDLGDRARVALATLTSDRMPLARIDEAFAGGESQTHAAYALAGDLARTLLARHGAGSTRLILARVAAGQPFEIAFREATGESVAAFEREYWRRRTLWDRWIPVLSSSVLLWAGIALLAIAAFRRRRVRDAQLARRWLEDEEMETGGDRGEPPSGTLRR